MAKNEFCLATPEGMGHARSRAIKIAKNHHLPKTPDEVAPTIVSCCKEGCPAQITFGVILVNKGGHGHLSRDTIGLPLFHGPCSNSLNK